MKNLITDLQKLVAMPGATWMHLNDRLEAYIQVRKDHAEAINKIINPIIFNWLNGSDIEVAFLDNWIPLENRLDGALIEFFGFSPHDFSIWKFRIK